MRNDIFNDLKDIQQEMLKILGEVSTLTNNPIHLCQGNVDIWQPKCDVYETDSEYVILVELAGVTKEQINVSTSSEYIKIYGERFITPECQDLYYHNMEIESGSFQRKIYFPEIPLDKENPKVTYVNGLLMIKFPIKSSIEKTIKIE